MTGSILDYQAAAVGFAVAFMLVLLLTPAVSLAAWRAGLLDRPDDDRRLHRDPMPRLGGIAIFAAIAIPAAALGNEHGLLGRDARSGAHDDRWAPWTTSARCTR